MASYSYFIHEMSLFLILKTFCCCFLNCLFALSFELSCLFVWYYFFAYKVLVFSFILLTYSWFTVLCSFLLYSKVIQFCVCVCVCVCAFLYSSPLWFKLGMISFSSFPCFVFASSDFFYTFLNFFFSTGDWLTCCYM